MNNVKKSIGWCDYTINPVKGLCPMGCSYCYARAIYKRFHMDETIQYDPYQLMNVLNKPSRIFVGSTIDLFHNETKKYMPDILRWCTEWDARHTYIFLTKCPENLVEFSPFPDNCWVGCSFPDDKAMFSGLLKLIDIEAKVKFISFEPLRSELSPLMLHILAADGNDYKKYIDWLIIGQQTPVRKSTMPEIRWIQEIVEAADMAEIPVFLKDNLISLIPHPPVYPDALLTGEGKLRQEFPDA